MFFVKENFFASFIDQNTGNLNTIPEHIKTIFFKDLDRIHGLRLWGNEHFRFCANNKRGLHSLEFIYTMYDVQQKKFTLILLSHDQRDQHNQYNLDSYIPKINTNYLVDDVLFNYVQKFRSNNPMPCMNIGLSESVRDSTLSSSDVEKYNEYVRKYSDDSYSQLYVPNYISVSNNVWYFHEKFYVKIHEIDSDINVYSEGKNTRDVVVEFNKNTNKIKLFKTMDNTCHDIYHAVPCSEYINQKFNVRLPITNQIYGEREKLILKYNLSKTNYIKAVDFLLDTAKVIEYVHQQIIYYDYLKQFDVLENSIRP